MGREGGEETFHVATKEELDKLVKEHHEKSQRQRVYSLLPGIFENKDAATRAVEEEKSRLGKSNFILSLYLSS